MVIMLILSQNLEEYLDSKYLYVHLSHFNLSAPKDDTEYYVSTLYVHVSLKFSVIYGILAKIP